MREVNGKSRCNEKRYRTLSGFTHKIQAGLMTIRLTCLLWCGVLIDSSARPKIREGELELWVGMGCL